MSYVPFLSHVYATLCFCYSWKMFEVKSNMTKHVFCSVQEDLKLSHLEKQKMNFIVIFTFSASGELEWSFVQFFLRLLLQYQID